MFRLTAAIILFFFSATPVFAQPTPELWTGNCIDSTSISGTKVATLQGFECLFKNILTIIIPLVGLGAFLVLILGGFQYLTSAGDPKQAQKAKSMITGAIIGITVMLGIWFIFQLINVFTGLDLLKFEIPN